MSLLDVTAEPGGAGPVIRLSGEADLLVAGQLSEALGAQVSGGAAHLTIDLSGLRFADVAAVRVLFGAHLVLTRRGGTLELTSPQPMVARMLSLTGADQVIPVLPRPAPRRSGRPAD